MRTTGFTEHFEAFATLMPHERLLLESVAVGPRMTHEAGERLRPERRILAAGWVASERSLTDGRRQLLQLSAVGEPLTFEELPGDLSFVALTPSVTVDGTRIIKAAKDALANPGLSSAFYFMQAELAFFAREQIARLGRMTALERVASLLVEISYRNRWTESFPFRLTQTHLADLLGLSVVHVNRTLQELRRMSVIDYGHQTLLLRDMSTLCKLACFVAPAWKR